MEMALPGGIELHYPVAGRVPDPIGEDSSSINGGELLQLEAESLPVEQVVAQNQGTRVPRDVGRSDHQRLRQALGLGLLGIRDGDPEGRAITEQSLERLRLVWRRDDQHIPDAREDERGQGVVDHRLVVDRQQLLADTTGDRVESSARSTSEKHTAHVSSLHSDRVGAAILAPYAGHLPETVDESERSPRVRRRVSPRRT